MIGSADISQALSELGVTPADTVFVHAGMQGALRAAGDSREAKMDTVVGGLVDAVAEGTLMLPTFTYSFCEQKDFDIAQTPSTVGMLTEHFRTRPGVERTAEPIFSTAVWGPVREPWREPLFGVGDKNCFGEQSVFAYLWEVDAVVAFFGVGFEYCTYLYLVEQRQEVPYRWLKRFTGEVVDLSGTPHAAAADYLVRDLEADVVNDFGPLANDLRARGLLGEHRIEKGPRLMAARARDIAAVATEQLASNPDYLLARGHEVTA